MNTYDTSSRPIFLDHMILTPAVQGELVGSAVDSILEHTIKYPPALIATPGVISRKPKPALTEEPTI